MSEDGQEKSFDATPEKLKQARQKGNIPISTDLSVFLSYVGFWLGLSMVGAAAVVFVEKLASFYWHPEAVAEHLFSGVYDDGGLVQVPLSLIAVLIVPAAAMVILGLIVQQGIVFAPSKIKFDLQRIDPIKGFKKKYGPTGMTEFAKAGAKVVLASVVGGIYLWSRRDHFMAAMGEGVNAVPILMREELLNIVGLAIGISLIVSLIDIPAKRSDHAKRLRMSRQEVTDENKEMEGDPSQKQARKKQAQAIANNQMLTATAGADVVIVNPTHYAVALSWDKGDSTAPVCVAKGVDYLAKSIIDRARLSGVPVREDPPCARALFATVDVGSAIHPEHYVAVAAAIRFADAVKRA